MPDVRTCFLIPETQDVEIGHGKLHSASVWMYFHRRMTETFGGWRVSTAISRGIWRDPKTGKTFQDNCREYVIALPRKDLPKLRSFLKAECVYFRQKVIYLEIGGDVEYIELDTRI